MKFLYKLQNLKPSIDTAMLLKESKEKEDIVKRISIYPLSIDHNAAFSSKRTSQIDEVTSSGASHISSKNRLLSQHDYLRRARALENAPQLFDKAFILSSHEHALNSSLDRQVNDIFKGDTYTQMMIQNNAWKISSRESEVGDNPETTTGSDIQGNGNLY